MTHALDTVIETVNQQRQTLRDGGSAVLLQETVETASALINSLSERQKAELIKKSPLQAMIGLILNGASRSELSAETKARLRGRLAMDKLLHAEGGTVGATEAANLLGGVRRQAVAKARASGRLLGIKVGNAYQYPIWQFQQGGILPGLREVLAVLPDEEWMRLEFFLQTHYGLQEQRPLDLLLAGRISDVLEVARTQGQQIAV